MGRRVALVLALREPELVHTIGHYYTVCPASTMFRDGKSCTKVCPRR